jgi:hypothetical protein
MDNSPPYELTQLLQEWRDSDQKRCRFIGDLRRTGFTVNS